MDRTEVELLDALDDARERLRSHKRLMGSVLLMTSGLTLFTIGYFIMLSALHSMGIDWGDASGIPGVLTGTLAVFGIIVIGLLNEGTHPAKILKKHERAYRDYLSRQTDTYEEQGKAPTTDVYPGLTFQGINQKGHEVWIKADIPVQTPRILRKLTDGTEIWIDDNTNHTWAMKP